MREVDSRSLYVEHRPLLEPGAHLVNADDTHIGIASIAHVGNPSWNGR